MPPTPRRADISPLSVLMRRIDAVTDGAPQPDTIATGFPSVDKLLGGGVRRGDLIVVGGDVGSGKSAFSLAVALRAAAEGRRVALRSGEMSVERLIERALAVEGRARVDDIRRGTLDETARAAIGAAAVRLRDQTPSLDRIADDGFTSLAEELRAESRADDRVELLVVDGLHTLVSGPRELGEETAAAARQLKALALDTHVAVLVTAPLPALTRERRDMRPQLDDFGALGVVKQLADVVLALFREEMYDNHRGVEGATELLVLKNRNGATGYADLYFYKQWMRFEDMLDPDR